MPARAPSSTSSSSGASFHSAHENRRSMYPGMQARVSDAEDSELSRRPRRTYPQLTGSDHRDEDSDLLMPPARGNAGMHERVSELGYGARGGRSHQLQSSVSYSSLAPEDSISNRGTSPSDNGYMLRHPCPNGYTNIIQFHPYAPGGSHAPSSDLGRRIPSSISSGSSGNPGYRYPSASSSDSLANRGHRYYSSSSSDCYSEGPRTPRHYGDTVRRSRHIDYDYGDDDDEPFTPIRTRFRHDSDDDEEEEAYTRRHRDSRWEEEQVELEEQALEDLAREEYSWR